MLAPWLYWFNGRSKKYNSHKIKSKNADENNNNKDNKQYLEIPEEEMQLMKFYEQNSNNDHTIPKSLQRKYSSDSDTKVMVILSILQEMGINDKSPDEVLAALMNHNMDENSALDSLFSTKK